MTGIDNADTAWVMAATALVLLMTPALGLFYAGLVREKNTLNTFMMCLSAFAVAGISWAVIGYSLAFDGDGPLVGGLGHAFMAGVAFAPRPGQHIPQLLFFAFQGTFCILTVALLGGAVAERMRFVPFLAFTALWSVLVYPVLAHWVFGGGWLAAGGTLDFAGGVPVEMGSGFSALAAALVVGARKDYGRQALIGHNAMFVLVGAGLLWFGWLGFNGGSGLGIDRGGILAFVNTVLCPCATLVVWFALDFLRGRQATAVGAATAIVVGAVAITPAGGFVSPAWALLLGAVAAVPCYFAILWRPRTRVDETLDVLAAHGIAGLTGTLFIGVAASVSWNGVANGLIHGNPALIGHQALAVLVTPLYAFGASFLLLRAIALVTPLRGTETEEAQGMDIVHHGEEAYPSGEGALLFRTEPSARELTAR